MTAPSFTREVRVAGSPSAGGRAVLIPVTPETVRFFNRQDKPCSE